MLTGILFALAACLVWGSTYVAPLILSDYSPVLITLVRYTVFGAVCVAVVASQLRRALRTSARDRLLAVALGIVGNLVYFWLITEAVVRVGGAVAGAFTSMIPVVCTITANLTARRPLPWKPLALPLAMILGGLVVFNAEEFARLEGHAFFASGADFALGVAAALGSVAIWTWFPLSNSRWLREHPGFPGSLWLAMQGAALLPVSLVGLAFLPEASGLLGRINATFVFWIVVMAIGCSWIGNALWNAASRRMPAVLIGQMLIFETLAAVLYASLWQGETVTLTAAVGLAAELLGIALTVRLCSAQEPPSEAPKEGPNDGAAKKVGETPCQTSSGCV